MTFLNCRRQCQRHFFLSHLRNNCWNRLQSQLSFSLLSLAVEHKVVSSYYVMLFRSTSIICQFVFDIEKTLRFFCFSQCLISLCGGGCRCHCHRHASHNSTVILMCSGTDRSLAKQKYKSGACALVVVVVGDSLHHQSPLVTTSFSFFFSAALCCSLCSNIILLHWAHRWCAMIYDNCVAQCHCCCWAH